MKKILYILLVIAFTGCLSENQKERQEQRDLVWEEARKNDRLNNVPIHSDRVKIERLYYAPSMNESELRKVYTLELDEEKFIVVSSVNGLAMYPLKVKHDEE